MVKGLNVSGVTQFVSAVLKSPKLLVPHLSVKDINDIPFAKLHALGFKGVVFDKDNTLTVPYKREIVPRVQDAVNDCQSVFGYDCVLIFSNSAGSSEDAPAFNEASAIEDSLRMKVLRHGTKKPNGIEALTSALQVAPHELIMVGDRYSTDVLFGNSNGMLTVRTDQLDKSGESMLNLTMQAIENAILGRLYARGVEAPAHALYGKDQL
ncbi:HAD superfamily (subfamily IIIA) phosphatase [Saprolegnia diclina VS20]|uniref:HAD superfamily (Subfamily IIIA) phosphatase n=1 Tax=Saprolegnia diclina (strain VS20) TaxID=1156394 RepID=T0RUR0_SAPDV|nr:HAD superfamily (subfamily IIIA) phosphatase [Saprolegnia diclina VS20]EQC36208.1 HAD superfamily (subfamily IIIA) phosphatase [Saprolegnia diclina VS20]|eukprot:XP_008610314.1 HAD superfamily (subfamily IIIA) phosphatase [Saprolegnia diclina VS20]